MTYIEQLLDAYKHTKATKYDDLPCDDPVGRICTMFKGVRVTGNKVMLIGNGGSAAIASHMAIDLSKNARVPAMAFNDACTLTCLSNDYGYSQVFAQQMEYHARPDDILVAISSSGESPSIINAVNVVRRMRRVPIITFSGFKPDNQLRDCGTINFYVPSLQYGFVELTHQIILHQIVDALTEECERVEAMESVPSA